MLRHSECRHSLRIRLFAGGHRAVELLQFSQLLPQLIRVFRMRIQLQVGLDFGDGSGIVIFSGENVSQQEMQLRELGTKIDVFRLEGAFSASSILSSR